MVLFLCSQQIYATEVLAVVNEHKITTEIAPKNFHKLSKKEQEKVVSRLVEKYLAANYALHTDIVNDPEYEKVLGHILKYTPSKSSDGSLISEIKKVSGYTQEQLFQTKGLLAFKFLLEKNMKSMHVDEKELQEYYNQNKYKYDTPEMVELAVITVETQEKAKQVLQSLKNSNGNYLDFSKLAKEYSKSPESKEGGYMGKIATLDLQSDIRKKLRSLKRGEHTDIVKTPFGYAIYYLVNFIPAVDTTFPMVQEKVKDEYLHKKTKEWAVSKIAALKNSAKITYTK